MATAPIFVAPDDNFDDWVVRAADGREFAHYPTRESAERFAREMAQQLRSDLIIQFPDGALKRERFAKPWFAHRFGW
jgi:hypothetical protein